MDPSNTNPTAPNPAPVAPDAGANPALQNQAPAAPVAPVAPVASAAPVEASAAAPAASVNPDVANAALNPPVNPVVAPGAAPAAPAMPGATMSMNQMFQPQSAANAGVIDETTAISVPEGPKPVDPVEEELKAPLKAAGPVPGSIGSAVSMPQEGGAAPQNVAFNDPAQPGANPMTANAAPQVKKNSFLDKLMAKTKMSKNTLILLAIVAGLIVVLLVAVLVMVATGVL